MSLERELKETLMRHASDVEPDTRSFEQVAARVKRARYQRLAVGATLVVALIAALSVVVPRLVGDTRDEGFIGPGGSESPSPAPAPDDGWVTVRDEQDGYQLRMPADWRVTEFEGAVELLPPGMVGTTAGEDTFAVELMLSRLTRSAPRSMDTTIAGRPATSGSISEARDDLFGYSVHWYGSTCEEVTCFLNIVIFSSTPELADRFGQQAETVVERIEHIDDAALPTGEVRTRRGVISAEVGFDQRTAFLTRFLEARAHGDGAEEYLSPAFAESYDGNLSMIDGEFILTFEVTSRAEADANSSEFTVVLDDGAATETIGVGVGSDGLEIRFLRPAAE